MPICGCAHCAGDGCPVVATYETSVGVACRMDECCARFGVCDSDPKGSIEYLLIPGLAVVVAFGIVVCFLYTCACRDFPPATTRPRSSDTPIAADSEERVTTTVAVYQPGGGLDLATMV
jgi:hypothetical protein